MKYVRSSRFTDAEFIYTPSQIALASLALASPLLAQRWADSKTSAGSAQPLSEIMEPTIGAIKYNIAQTGHPPDVEAVREVDRRLKLCKNPEKVPGSKAYLARQAEEDKRAAEKRHKKAENIRRAITESNPFGSELNEDEKATQLADLDDDDD